MLLPAGTYYLDRPVTVRQDNVVIRGEGTDKTRLIFRYAIPPNGVGFYHPPAGSRVGKETRIEYQKAITNKRKEVTKLLHFYTEELLHDKAYSE